MPEFASWYHADVKSVGRANRTTKSFVGLASYITGQQLYDQENRRTAHRGHPGEVTSWGIEGAAGAPARMLDRGNLGATANEVHRSETRINSHLGNHWDFALWRNGPKEEHAEVMQKIAKRAADKWGVIVIWSVHAPPPHGDDRNWHGHLGHNMRQVGPDGFGDKFRMDRAGAKAYTIWMRETIAEEVNAYLERKGIPERVTADSYATRGIAKEPTKHLGNKQNQAELQGIPTPTGDKNRAIKERNEAHEAEIINLPAKRLKRVAQEHGQMLSQQDHQIHAEAAQIPPAFEKVVNDIEAGKLAYEEFMKRRAAEAATLAEEEKKRQPRDEKDIADPHSYYAMASSRFNANNIHSVVNVTNEEYRLFMHRQEDRVLQEAAEKDPDKKKIIELERRIEGAAWLVETNERLAKWSAYTTGKGKEYSESEIIKELRQQEHGDNAPRTAYEEHIDRADKWREFGEKWREERHDLMQVVRGREMSDFGQQVKDVIAGKEMTDAKQGKQNFYGIEIDDAAAERIARRHNDWEEGEAAREADMGRSVSHSR